MEPFARIPGIDDAARREAIERAVGRRRHSTRCANLGTFTGYRIGLDIGNGNIGWCILFERGTELWFLRAEDITAHNAALSIGARRTQLPDLDSFVPLGTHKFQAREPGKTTERSLSKIRMESRSSRRLLDARQRRRLMVRQALETAGLLPMPGEELQGHPTEPADQLRVRLLDPTFPASRHDLGRALLNLLSRRGYMQPIGRLRRGENTDFAENIGREYRAALQSFHCRTLGEFLERCAQDAKKDGVYNFRKRHSALAWQEANKKQRPKNHTTAKSYEVFWFLTPSFDLIRDEAHLLREMQKHNVPISDENWALLEEAAAFRRDLKAKTPGRCQFLRATEWRCVRALPSFQRFRILEQVSNLRDQHGRQLDDDAFRKVVSLLQQTETIRVEALARELGRSRLLLEGEDEGRRTLIGAKTDITLTEVLGDRWSRMSEIDRDAWTMRILRRHNTDAAGNTPPWRDEDEAALKQDADRAFGDKMLARVDKEAGKSLEDKFAKLSAKAARIRADCYERRQSHDQHMAALSTAGMPAPELALFQGLPYYGEIMSDETVPVTGFAPESRICSEELEFGRAPNPDVHVVLNRIRAVVNAIIDMMGGILPTTCVVEVARSALSEEDAAKYTALTRARNSLRDRIVADIDKVFEGLGRRRPIGPSLDRLVDRWKAAYRQGWRDYDGSSIERSLLVDPLPYQLDHVSPAKFGEFRESNLFVSRFNQAKGPRLPWQAFGDDAGFRPALLAFAAFGFEQRVDLLKKSLASRTFMSQRKRAQLQSRLDQSVEAHQCLESYGIPRPDTLTALKRTLVARPDGSDSGAPDSDMPATRHQPTLPFKPSDQAALFCRFHPDARPPERSFAARDTANIGWNTKLALRYLRHLGAIVEPVKPSQVHAFRCMFDLNKDRQDLRNHALDAFVIAHFDAQVLRPAFDRLRGGLEELYGTRVLGVALRTIDGGEGFIDRLKASLNRLAHILPTIATAHRPDHRWNPADPMGGSFGALGGENIYAFRPSLVERKRLTEIVAKTLKTPVEDHVMTRKELLKLLASDPIDEVGRRLRTRLAAAVTIRYRTRSAEKGKITSVALASAVPLAKQPGAFINAESKFAIVGPGASAVRRILSVAEFSAMSEADRCALFAEGRPIYRSGDTVGVEGQAFVITGLERDGRLSLYPVDFAPRDKAAQRRPTIPSKGTNSSIVKIVADVLGRRLHRLRKDPRGLQPVPYPPRGQ